MKEFINQNEVMMEVVKEIRKYGRDEKLISEYVKLCNQKQVLSEQLKNNVQLRAGFEKVENEILKKLDAYKNSLVHITFKEGYVITCTNKQYLDYLENHDLYTKYTIEEFNKMKNEILSL